MYNNDNNFSFDVEFNYISITKLQHIRFLLEKYIYASGSGTRFMNFFL